MKKMILLIMILIGYVVKAQIVEKVRFEYDSAGNQILRRWCLNCGFRYVQNDFKEISALEDTDMFKFFAEDVISYYPNPVNEELFLKWDLINGNKVIGLDIYTINGQIKSRMQQNSTSNTLLISFRDYPSGIYFLNLNYSNGDQKSIKIVKN